MPIKQGELINFNPLEEEIEVQLIENEIEREKTPTIGYYAMFRYINGFEKAMYWSKEKMMSHADKYSPAFSIEEKTIKTGGRQLKKVSFEEYESGKYDEKDSWLYSSFWYKDFDGMACKTMLRQLISKWGIMSIEMEKAVTSDMAVINDKGEAEYVEEISELVETEAVEETVSVPKESAEPEDTEQDEFTDIMGG